MERNHFKNLPPDYDMQIVSDAARRCIEIARKYKYSLGDIIKMINAESDGRIDLNENTLKAFVSRSESSRAKKSNTLEILYNFFSEHWQKFDGPARTEMAGIWEAFTPDLETNGDSKKKFKSSMEHIFGGLLLNWMGTSPEKIHQCKEELCNSYFALRKSVRNNNIIVRSEVEIALIGPKDLSITHRHYDRNEDLRTSRGFMVPTDTNFVGIMNVEHGIAVEFIGVKKPQTEKYKRLVGFITTVNSDGALVCARTALIKKSEIASETRESIPIRFGIDEFVNDRVIMKTISFLEDDRAMTHPDKTIEVYRKYFPEDGVRKKT